MILHLETGKAVLVGGGVVALRKVQTLMHHAALLSR